MIPTPRPVRPDLAAVQPMYYPLIEQSRFGSVAAMCERHGWPLDVVQSHCEAARINRSDLAVLEHVALGDPDDGMRAVLVLQSDGAVILCAGLLGQMTADRDEANAIALQFGALPEFQGRLVAVGEFRPSPKGGPQ